MYSAHKEEEVQKNTLPKSEASCRTFSETQVTVVYAFSSDTLLYSVAPKPKS